MKKKKAMVLIILDGWGHRHSHEANAIAAAKKPNWDKFWQEYPHTLISGCGSSVGLPDGQMGNSEVGHLNIGAGRIVSQDLTRIDTEIANGKFFTNPVLLTAIDQAKNNNKAIHILGLLSPGGVHSHEQHIQALLQLAKQRHAPRVYIHAFLDGRDTPPRSALPSLQRLSPHIVTIVGRYYAMDRDKRWDRIQKTYDLLTNSNASYHAPNPEEALNMAYHRGETDEFVSPTLIHPVNESPIAIEEGDSVIFMNFRADRARELTYAFVDDHFNHFVRQHTPHVHFVTLTEYDVNLKNVSIAYPPQSLNNILPEYISKLGLQQLRLAETEKYAHVTFFFNGGIEQPYPGEERILIPSPHVATYDLQPEMSAPEVTDCLVKAITEQKYDMIICNFANADMVGHTGNFAATVKAIETLDTCLGKIVKALQTVDSEALITADHGNAELMFDDNTGQPHTAHTYELVPLLYIGRKAKVIKPDGILSDVAPTILYLMGLTKPQEMTGSTIFELE